MIVLGGPLVAIFCGLAIVGGVSGGFINAYVLSWEIKKIDEDDLNKIAEKCVFYNKRKNYSMKKTHCQKFVKDILKAINAPFNPNGEIRYIIEYISKNGYSTFSYQGTEFKSRREFDNFVKNINFRNLYDDDKKLLLCYKSLYDFRLKIIQKEEKQLELSEEEKLEKEKDITDDEEFWNELFSNQN